MKRRTLFPGMSGALAVLAAALTPVAALAQHDTAPAAPAYALENVTVHHADGRVEEGMTLVVRAGLLTALAAGAAVPADAVVLEGDSLHVYPGLVDAQGTVDFEFPESDGEDEILSWDPTREAQGFTPHRRVADVITATGADLRDQRQSGVVAAGVHPTDGLAAGQGASLVLRPNARRPMDLVSTASVGLSLSFQGARGVYPSTLFGVMAFLRQSFMDAERHGQVGAAFASNARGLTPPAWDPDLEVLREAESGGMPVYFTADGAEDIRRVLGLSDELGFRPVIMGGGGAWEVADELRDRGVPVLVSVAFPNPDEWEPPPLEPEEVGSPEGEPTDTVGAAAPEPGPVAADLEPAAAREKTRFEDRYANAGRLEAAGVRFALTSGGGEGDLVEGARRAIQYGLSAEAALRALTSEPAALLGMPAVSRIEQGGAATFVVISEELFAPDASVVYTFVEGGLERGRAPGGGEAPTVDVTGDWSGSLESEMGSMDLTMTLAQDGADFSGRIESAMIGEMQVRSGQVSGSDVSFSMVLNMGQEVVLTARGSVDGDRFRATGSSEFGSFTLRARRSPREGGAR